MVEKKDRVTEAQASRKAIYDQRAEFFNRMIEQAKRGKRVIKAREFPFEQNRHGFVRWYTTDDVPDPDNVVVFVNEIRTHGGRHVHQGGLGLFILKGKGYSVIDGVRYDWERGDLLMLPIKKGGCDHQHFNLGGRPSRWVALRSWPLQQIVGNFREQKEEHPDWKG